MQEAIIINNLDFNVGKVNILKNINFSVTEGEVFSLYGSSGCGKSTLLKIISGLLTPHNGTVSVFGINPAKFNNLNRTVATVWQSRALFPHLSVKENIWYGLKFKNISTLDKEKKYSEIINLLKIEYLQNRSLNKLSGGEEQKIALARALVIEPKVLLLDEPFTGIDKLYKSQLKEDLRELLQQVNCTFVFVSHDTDDIYSLSNRIAVIENHSISQIDTPSALFDNPSSKFIAESIGNYTIIPGHVISIDITKNIASIQTEIGIYMGMFRKEITFHIGEKVFYAIKADAYSIGNDLTMSANARLLGKEIKGNKCSLLLKLFENLTIKLNYSISEANDIIDRQLDKITHVLNVSWDVKDALVLKQ